jgi:methionyl-tRNA formyltransferase
MRIVFFGSPDFAVPTLRAVAAQHDVALVISQPDRPAGRGRAVSPPAVKQVALELGLPTLQPTKLRDPDLAARLSELGADAFVVVAYGRILPPALLDLPRLGPYNVHASLLPHYRGAAPIQWAVINGETQSGISIMRMEEGLDTGPVLVQEVLSISDEDTAGSLAARLAVLGAQSMVAVLPRIAAGQVVPAPQDHARATLAPMLEKEHGVLDFQRPARLVSAHARGVDPWPGATTVVDGEVVKLFHPRVVAGQGAPGAVLGLGTSGLQIACADGAVAFAELQFPGRKRLPAAAVLAGRPIPVGTIVSGKV